LSYDIIYADPPWKYNNEQSGDKTRGAKPYSSMTLEELKEWGETNVIPKASDNSFLFLWITMPKLAWAFELMPVWGFQYVTCAFTWVKTNPKSGGIYSGMGYWTNGNAELCLLGKKGKPKRQAKNVKQIVMAPRGRHSVKPPEVRDRIVALCGDLPRIELFARERATGWDAQGDEL